MFVLALLTCVVLRAFNAQAKVVDSFEECKGFFYQGKEPSGMDQNAIKICQKLENKGFYYATLYSAYHKIPLYSAYTLDPACSADNRRTDKWHLEPQISEPTSTIDHMVREDQNSLNRYNRNQAISCDYSRTNYDRGHLNPNSFQCGDGRQATFTLTNAAPMKGGFNRVHWRRWETLLRGHLIQKLITDNGLATAFIVTGTVPDFNVRIPEDSKKVTVPSHIWTAVCYKHHLDDSRSLSFGFIGRNQEEEPGIEPMSVLDLNDKLESLFRTNQQIEIFADDCFSVKDNLKGIPAVFQKLINLPVTQAIPESSSMQDKYLAVKRTYGSDSAPEKKVKMNEMTGKIAFDSMSTYYSVAEQLKVYLGVCLITYVKSQTRIIHDELRKREVSTGPDAAECQLEPERKTAADGTPCVSITESDYSCQCNTGAQTQPCCVSPCLYQDDFNGYRCYSDQKLIECSPPYSSIAVNGKRCVNDFPCATYGKDYYWCWTSFNVPALDIEWQYCSPPLWNSKAKNGKYCRNNHACAKYGYSFTWCYTDDEGNWDYC